MPYKQTWVNNAKKSAPNQTLLQPLKSIKASSSYCKYFSTNKERTSRGIIPHWGHTRNGQVKDSAAEFEGWVQSVGTVEISVT